MSYTVRPGTQKLRSAIVGLLVSEMKGERLPDRLDGYEQRVQVDGKLLLVTVIETSNNVAVSMDYGQSDAEFMKRVAATLDAALATGKIRRRLRSARPCRLSARYNLQLGTIGT